MEAMRQESKLSGITLICLGVLRFYKRFVSPLFPPACRFTPTCSEYAYDAMQRYGAGKGTWLTVKRLSRCHPFCKGGYDPVR